MRSHTDAHHTHHADGAAAAARSRSFLSNPWSQAVLTGVLTLIPTRNYPIWLRRSIIWGPTVIGAMLPAYLGASPQAHRKFTAGLDRAGLDNTPQTDGGPAQEPDQRNRAQATAIVAVACGTIGAILSAGMAVSFWADKKAEQGLRRLNVPFPRAVMGAAAGAAAWWSVVKENEREHPTAEGHEGFGKQGPPITDHGDIPQLLADVTRALKK